MTYIITASLITMLVSLSGVFFTSRFIGKYTSYLLTFSSGVFVIVVFNLVFEALEHSGSIIFTFLFVTIGVALLALADVLIPEGHHHHTDDDCHESHNRFGARKMLFGDAIHNIGDGIVLASSFLISPIVGITTTVGIIVHELIQEISEFFVLRQAGFSKKKALIWNFVVSSTILIGAIGTFFLSGFEKIEMPIISIAAGAFAYIVLKDLVPSSIKNSIRDRKYTKHILVFSAGVAVILLVSFFGGSH